MNKMYTPGSYFFGRFFSHLILQLYAPVLMSVIIFFCLGVGYEFTMFLEFLITCVEINLVGCTLGYMFGVAFNLDEAARQLSSLAIIFFHVVSGAFATVASFPGFIRILSYISPNRYSVEIFFRIFLKNNKNQKEIDYAFDKYGYNFGLLTCHLALVGFMIFFFLMAWLIINRKNKKFM